MEEFELMPYVSEKAAAGSEFSLDELLPQSRAELAELAAKAGLIAVFPRQEELLLDIDSPAFKKSKQWDLFVKSDLFRDSLVTESKSGNRHVWVRLTAPLPNNVRIALQVILGSDPMQGLLKLARGKFGLLEDPNVGFEKPAEALRIGNWRAQLDKVVEDDVPF